MDYQYILVDVKDRIATVTINRPEYSNAFARESYYEIADAMNTLGARDDVGVIVITGAGKHFSAGGDIKRFKMLVDTKTYLKAEDIEAAKKSFFALPDEFSNWHWNVTWWSDPVLLGKYPEEGLAKYEPYLPKITEEDMRLISQPIDVYGQNIYNGYCVRMGEDGRTETVSRYEGFPKTAIDWPVTPECLYWGPKFLYERYQKPIYITENGLSCHDVISLDRKVHDPNRIDFLARYLHELKKAAGEIDLRGYFQWSLMDNFEWAKGYSERFGLVYVDYPTQKRILKDSAYWYQKIIKENGSTL